MISFISFIVLVLIAVALNRSMAWGRRADARNRARFIAAGFAENNAGYRLRCDARKRLLLICYVVFAGVPMLIVPTLPFARFNAAAVVPVLDGLIQVLAWIPAFAIFVGTGMYQERTNPGGIVVLRDLAKKFHVVPRQIKPDGTYGSATQKTPEQIGIINMQGLQYRGFIPIVPDEDQKEGGK